MSNIKIGKVNIDLMHYSGKDIYSEGEIEDKLLKVAEEKTSKTSGSAVHFVPIGHTNEAALRKIIHSSRKRVGQVITLFSP